jgi:hypothetical protein
MSMMASVRPHCDSTRPRGAHIFVCVRFCRMQLDCVRAIQFIVRLCWLNVDVDLCWWQSDTIVRSLLKFIGAFC